MQKELDILHSTPERITFSMKKQKRTNPRTNILFISKMNIIHICIFLWPFSSNVSIELFSAYFIYELILSSAYASLLILGPKSFFCPYKALEDSWQRLLT